MHLKRYYPYFPKQGFEPTTFSYMSSDLSVCSLKPLGIFAFLQPHLVDLVRWKRLSDQVNLVYAIWTPGAFSCWLLFGLEHPCNDI